MKVLLAYRKQGELELKCNFFPSPTVAKNFALYHDLVVIGMYEQEIQETTGPEADRETKQIG